MSKNIHSSRQTFYGTLTDAVMVAVKTIILVLKKLLFDQLFQLFCKFEVLDIKQSINNRVSPLITRRWSARKSKGDSHYSVYALLILSKLVIFLKPV